MADAIDEAGFKAMLDDLLENKAEAALAGNDNRTLALFELVYKALCQHFGERFVSLRSSESRQDTAVSSSIDAYRQGIHDFLLPHLPNYLIPLNDFINKAKQKAK